MPDIGDDAAGYAAIYDKAALANQKRKSSQAETPLVIDGIRLCKDCEDAIPEERLAKMPFAVRCIHCQEIKEARERADGRTW